MYQGSQLNGSIHGGAIGKVTICVYTLSTPKQTHVSSPYACVNNSHTTKQFEGGLQKKYIHTWIYMDIDVCIERDRQTEGARFCS